MPVQNKPQYTVSETTVNHSTTLNFNYHFVVLYLKRRSLTRSSHLSDIHSRTDSNQLLLVRKRNDLECTAILGHDWLVQTFPDCVVYLNKDELLRYCRSLPGDQLDAAVNNADYAAGATKVQKNNQECGSLKCTADLDTAAREYGKVYPVVVNSSHQSSNDLLTAAPICFDYTDMFILFSELTRLINRSAFGLVQQFRLQFKDADFGNEYVNLMSTSEIRDRDTVKVVFFACEETSSSIQREASSKVDAQESPQTVCMGYWNHVLWSWFHVLWSDVSDAADRLVKFMKVGRSMETFLKETGPAQPFLLCIGERSNSIQNFYIVLDQKAIPCLTHTGVAAFDELFKAHFAFAVSYNEALCNFYTFIQPCTASMLAVCENLSKNSSHCSLKRKGKVTQDGCGTQKACTDAQPFCVSGPDDCVFASLVFTATQSDDDRELFIKVRGDVNDAKFVGLWLPTESNSPVFICARNSTGHFVFQVKDRSSLELSNLEKDVRDIRGSVEGDVIQCEFKIKMREVTAHVPVGTVNGNFVGDGPATINDLRAGISAMLTVPVMSAEESTDKPAETENTMPSGASRLFHSRALTVLLTILTMFAMHSA
ncbi:hypothetical protein JOB18_042267 [Solea senegalensis]|uniref:Uncharacterized protein n=1 Tax=Solea senegalensis TaxID=28829 RepID=A0AAV6TB14_SOLSE|nr:hypothetical protein JOB18_042267 [Solea senegalensis]